jgi:4-amino-4-deoxy-L-arabinose transferase-like glycosyltransferase
MTMSDPTRAPQTGRHRWLAPLGLAALLGALFFFRLGDDLPFRTHEALLAVSARNMVLNRPVQLDDGSHPSPYLVPNFNDEPRLRKTPLPYWMAAGVARLTGRLDEWSARLPSALSALGTVLILTVLLGRWCDRRTAFLGGAALATSVGFLTLARSAMADMPLTLFITASLAALWMGVEASGRRRFAWFTLAGATAGLAVLAKGPVPLITFPAPYLVAAGVVLARLRRRRRTSVPARRDCAGEVVRGEWGWTLGGAAVAMLVFLAIALPWPAYVALRVPHAMAIWHAESVGRAAGELGREEPPWFYFLRLPMLVAPWTVFFLCGLVLALGRARRAAQDRPWLLFVGAWLLGPLGAFSLAAGKQDHYILPILPAAAVYTALAMRHFLAPAPPRTAWPGRGLLLAHSAAAILAGAIGPLAYVVWRAAPTSLVALGVPANLAVPAVLVPAAVLGVLGIAGGLAAFSLGMRRRLVAGQAVLFATFAAAFVWAWPTLIGPMDRVTTAAQFARQVRRIVPPDAPLFTFIEPHHTVVYYVERPLPVLRSTKDIRDRISQGEPFFLFCDEKKPGKIQPVLRDVPALTPVLRMTNPYRPGETFWLFHWPANSPSAHPSEPSQERSGSPAKDDLGAGAENAAGAARNNEEKPQ